MPAKDHSLSVVMPALNEEKNIEAAVQAVEEIIPKYFTDWEILIFNDGSVDNTGRIANTLAETNPKIKVTHHTYPHNLGGVYKAGIKKASKDYLIMVPGDNENGNDTLGDIFELAGEADIILPYVNNPEVRPLKRRLLSKGFVALTNLLSGLSVKYYNGTVLHKTKLLQSITIRTNSFGYAAEAIVKLIRMGHTYKEVGIELATRPKGSSKALRLNNVVKVLGFLGDLYLQIRQKNKKSI